MNTLDPTKTNTAPKQAANLLETIKAVRATVGDGLNDDELTRLLRQTTLLNEAGFGFLSFSGGFVTLSVPTQDKSQWYPKSGWIAPEKEKLAAAIAAKHGFVLNQPPDEVSSFLFRSPDRPEGHHHLEFCNRWENVVIAHPNYLKVRLLGAGPESRYVAGAKEPLPLGPDLLQDLSALYRTCS
jgi:hypothetical protein